jgi:hypothetical protein
MFLVGGGILLHGIPVLGHAVEAFVLPMGWLGAVVSSMAGAVAGLLAGAATVLVFSAIQRLRGKGATAAH